MRFRFLPSSCHLKWSRAFFGWCGVVKIRAPTFEHPIAPVFVGPISICHGTTLSCGAPGTVEPVPELFAVIHARFAPRRVRFTRTCFISTRRGRVFSWYRRV